MPFISMPLGYEVVFVIDTGEVTIKDTSSDLKLWSAASIDDDTVIRLCSIALKVEQGFGHPCDIEWAIFNNNINLLQVNFLASN